ncbi:hypothetical protein [Fulvimarina manganoxydans]|nr:hypothetical protein [Fulvimarina manganoxydans]
MLILTGFALYWVVGMLAEGPWLTAVVAAAKLVFGVVVFFGWGPDAWGVLRSKYGKVEGRHYALLGIVLISLGVVYSGTFGIAWVVAGRPMEWLGTLYSNFGNFWLTGGLILLAVSPDVTKEGFQPPHWYYIIAGGSALAIVAFLLGTQWAGADREEAYAPHIYGQSYPICPIDRPVKGNRTNRGKIYHEPSSIDYHRTIAERCFVDVASARGAGYRPPG